VPTLEGDRPLAAPKGADDLDPLLQCLERLTTGPQGTAHRPDRLPERTRTQPELEAAAREQVERGRLLAEQGGTAQREIGDVREDADAFRPRQLVSDQRERVQVAPLVRVILDPDQIEAELVGAPSQGA
jgi:hypothetical protein